jgi:methenyltetrahydromethanopterin cyclohydrolase
MDESWDLNQRAAAIAEEIAVQASRWGVDVAEPHPGVRILDCGVKAAGGLQAGVALAQACLGGRGSVTTTLDHLAGHPLTKVTVVLDRPYVPCLLSQYAGWQIAKGKYFAMGSGPMRALARKEAIFEELEFTERSDIAVGVLETSALPTEEVIAYLREATGNPRELILLPARTASLAGSLQIVARSVETCLHKLHELKFDVRQVLSAMGSAFLPPIPKDDLTAIGRTNDSILYGGDVVLWVNCDEALIDDIGPKIPASFSDDYGTPFRSIFERYQGDFYKIDPLLFSPGRVAINNRKTGSWRTFGKLNEEVLAASFFGLPAT